MMKVSIIIPTYKGSSAILRAVDSALEQTYKNIEVIVVDDNFPGSDERMKTESLMEKYVSDKRVIYKKHNKNRNGATARNTGINVASGSYIAFLDDDDYYLPKRVESCVNYLEKNRNLVGVYVGVDVIDSKGNINLQIRPCQELTVADLLEKNMVLGTGSNIFLRSNLVKKVKGFDETFVRFQDLEFMIRVCHEGKIGYIADRMIVKSVNGTMNHPKYERMKDVINQFTNKFELDIEELGEKKNIYYSTQYRTLFNIALYERDIDEIKEAKALIEKYDKLSLKEYMQVLVYTSGIRDWFIITVLVDFKKRLLSKLRGWNEKKYSNCRSKFWK